MCVQAGVHACVCAHVHAFNNRHKFYSFCLTYTVYTQIYYNSLANGNVDKKATNMTTENSTTF